MSFDLSKYNLLKKYNINVDEIPIISDSGIVLSFEEKALILDKLLEAHELAIINVKMGNITGRGFASNICSYENVWALGTNFNNTRNDISSICAERSAILALYNNALLNKLKNPELNFDLKIKYICMAPSIPLNEIDRAVVPCEDCLSWLNTNRFFDDETCVFCFEKNNEGVLSIKISKLIELLPFRNTDLSFEFSENKKIRYSKNAQLACSYWGIETKDILTVMKKNHEEFLKYKFQNISKQNIVCSILANDEIFSCQKLDWTKRWFVEPLEVAAYNAIQKFGQDIKISMVSYLGNPISKNNNHEFNDGVVSIKSLGRIRQKYATSDTILALNLKDEIYVVTMSDYLPQKFIQGYKIV